MINCTKCGALRAGALSAAALSAGAKKARGPKVRGPKYGWCAFAPCHPPSGAQILLILHPFCNALPPSGDHSPLHPPDWGRHRMCLADWRPPARSHPLVSRGSACKAPPYIVAGGRKARPGTEVLKSRGGPAPGSDGPPFQRFFILNPTPGCVVICFPQGFSPRPTRELRHPGALSVGLGVGVKPPGL